MNIGNRSDFRCCAWRAGIISERTGGEVAQNQDYRFLRGNGICAKTALKMIGMGYRNDKNREN